MVSINKIFDYGLGTSSITLGLFLITVIAIKNCEAVNTLGAIIASFFSIYVGICFILDQYKKAKPRGPLRKTFSITHTVIGLIGIVIYALFTIPITIIIVSVLMVFTGIIGMIENILGWDITKIIKTKRN